MKSGARITCATLLLSLLEAAAFTSPSASFSFPKVRSIHKKSNIIGQPTKLPQDEYAIDDCANLQCLDQSDIQPTSQISSSIRFKLLLSDAADQVYLATRPKKKKVSLHSTLASVAVGSSLVALLPSWSPSLFTQEGWFLPLIFDYHRPLSQSSILQCQFSSVLLCVVAILGHFRFPKNTPYGRKVIFDMISSAIGLDTLLSLSNIFGSGHCIVDGWSAVGRAILAVSFIAVHFNWAKSSAEVIAGPENSGREFNPFYQTRRAGAFSNLVYIFSIFFQFLPLCALFESREYFEINLASMYQNSSLGSFYLASFHTTILYLSLGAFFGTLYFEGKISKSTSNLVLAITAAILLGPIYYGLLAPNFRFFLSINGGIMQRYHLRTIYGAFLVCNILNAIRRRIGPQIISKFGKDAPSPICHKLAH